MELWTGALFWWKCHWPYLKTAGLFPSNLLLNSLKNLNIVTLTLAFWPINSGVMSSLLLQHLLSSLTDSLASLNLLCHSKTDARFLQSEAFHTFACYLSKFETEFIAYRSSKVSWRPDCIYEIHELWQSGLVGCIQIAAAAVHLNLKS